VNDDTLDLFAGEQRKGAVLTRHEHTRADILELLRHTLAMIASGSEIMGADEARDLLTEWAADKEPGAAELLRARKDWMGTLFRGKEWEAVGWAKSKHPENYARPIRTWRLKRFT
jgi:hypothetical protein